jgi:hypothetical protein
MNHYYRVYSGDPSQLEESGQGNLEAIFKNEKECEEYVSRWMKFYPKGDVIFWYEKPVHKVTG